MLTSFLDADGVHAGGSTRVAFEVRLPRGYHVNSNAPLDKYLIPTELSLDVPEGLTVEQTVYPKAMLLETSFSDEPLSVYEDFFLIGVAFALADNVAPGEHTIRASLRYQACDEKACYRPASEEVDLVLSVVPRDRAVKPQHASIFDSIDFPESK